MGVVHTLGVVRASAGGLRTFAGIGGLSLTIGAAVTGRVAFVVAGAAVMEGRAAWVDGSLPGFAAEPGVREGGDVGETTFLRSVRIVVPNAIGVAF